MQRPHGVPDGAAYQEDDRLWEHGPLKGGVRHGAYSFWRPDGTKQAEIRFKDGVRHGPFRIFHETGDIAREGSYRAGELHGTVTCKRTDGATTEAMFDGAGDAVWRTEVEYDMGRVLAVRHFDQGGHRVLADGTALPEHPRGVPSLAQYDVAKKRWYHGPKDGQDQRTGLWMWWTQDGTLVEESEFRDGLRQGVCRLYTDDGTLTEEGSYAEGKKTGTFSFYEKKGGRLAKKVDYDDDQLHGSYIEFGPDGRSRVRIEYDGGKKDGQFLARIEKDKYRGGKIRVEKGHFKQDVPVGRWKLLDKGLKPVFTVDFGVPRTDEDEVAASEVFDDDPRDAAYWTDLSTSLFEGRVIGEGLLARARAAAALRDGAGFAKALEERCAPLAEAAAEELAEQILDDASDQFHAMAGALVAGATPARMLQAIAVALDRKGRPIAARDFIDAALLVFPEERGLHYTRALVNVSLGEAMEALHDARALEDDQPESSRFLQGYVRALFPIWDFWPTRDTPSGGGAIECVRDLDEVHDVLQRYATRFEAVRRQLLRRVDAVMEWAPPDPAPLLPEGPLALRRDDDVNELIDVAGLDLQRLLREARCNWAALCWLCWAAGERRCRLPRRLHPPSTLGAAVTRARKRHQLTIEKTTPGKEPAESFAWEGIDLEEMAPHLAEVCRAELEHIDRALTWLSDSSVVSPFVVGFPVG